LLPRFNNPQRFLSGAQGALCDLEFQIQFKQVEIIGSDVTYYDRDYSLAVFFAGR